MLARIERFDATVERFLALGNTVLCRAHFAHAFLVFRLGFLLDSQSFVLCFDDGLAAQRLGLPLGIGNH